MVSNTDFFQKGKTVLEGIFCRQLAIAEQGHGGRQHSSAPRGGVKHPKFEPLLVIKRKYTGSLLKLTIKTLLTPFRQSKISPFYNAKSVRLNN